MSEYRRGGIRHQNAVANIKDMIEKELGIEGKEEENGIFNRLIPDLTFKNNKGHLLIIEVGTTQAEKIVKYQNYDEVMEIRWYSKDSELVGQWIRIKGRWNQTMYFRKRAA